jgi:ElaB/YqjD/DUF883 family membrane-anchored ribosome-binding protein
MENEPEMIRRQMAATRTALTDKLALLEQRAEDTVERASTAVRCVKENVEGAARMVHKFVQEAAETVKDACDLERQVNWRPWTMMAGATALGYLGGRLLRGGRAGHGMGNARGATTAMDEPSWFATLSDTFQPELAQLKRLAVETLLSVVRDLAAQTLPKPRERQAKGMTDDIIMKPERGRYL